MRAVVLEGPGTVALVDRPDPSPGAGEVVVEVAACGLCGTDIHLLDGDLPDLRYPVVPGHEFHGEVVAVGTGVDERRIGSRVAVNPNIPCRRCRLCRSGRTNLCDDYRALGVTTDGAFAEFVRVPHELCFALPPEVSLVAATLIEPLSCVIHGVDRLPCRPGDRYLVYGAGAVGLLMARTLTSLSDAPVDMVDINADRLGLAVDLGMRVATSADEFDERTGWDTVIDCTGSADAIADALTRVRRGGVLQLFGVAAEDARVAISPFDLYRNEITIVGSMAVLNSFERAVAQLAAWGDEVDRLISHTCDLDQYDEAVAVFRSGRGTKVVINPGGPR